MTAIGHEERTRAVIEQAKRRSETVRTEHLPPEVRMVIEQLKAMANDHETRLTMLERINQALIAEASAKVRGAA